MGTSQKVEHSDQGAHLRAPAGTERGIGAPASDRDGVRGSQPRLNMNPVEYLFSLERFGIKLGLDTIRTLRTALGHPDRRFRSILIAGTNGKGSVAAMVERGLRAAGYRTGLFTSPHLVNVTERFALDGRGVDPTTLAVAAGHIRETIEALRRDGTLEHPPTFFEATTALALSLFARHSVDVAVLEVGMGGRFDATNVVTPVGVAIPSIDIDHQQYLGATLAQIAFEKAGVIKPNSVVVTAESKREPRDVLRAACAAHHARLVAADTDVDIRWRAEEGTTLIDEMETPHRHYGPMTLSLRGRHQLGNAAVAVRLLEELTTAGIEVPAAAIVEALTDTRWPGRLEWLPVEPTGRVLLDPAHNVAAAVALKEYVMAWHPAGLPFVFSALRDKDVPGILRALDAAVTGIVCTTIDSPRAQPLGDLVRAARETRPDLTVHGVAEPRAALAAAWREGPAAVAAGSVFLVGQIMRELGRA